MDKINVNDHPVIQEMSLPVAEVEVLKVPHDLYEIWEEEECTTIQARKSFYSNHSDHSHKGTFF